MAYLSQIANSKSVKKMHGRITADKRLRYASPKLPLATSFIHKTLGNITSNTTDGPDDTMV